MSALALSMENVISLCIGEPDLDTPSHITEAASKALRAGFTHYAPSGGLLELKEAVARRYSNATGLEYGPENVIITTGAGFGELGHRSRFNSASGTVNSATSVRVNSVEPDSV